MTCTCRSIACGTASRSTPSGAVRTVAAACTKRASGGSVSSAIRQVPGASASPAPVGTYSAMSPSPTSGSATTSLANRTVSQLSSSNALSCTTRPSGASTRVMPRPNPSSSRAAVNSSETAPLADLDLDGAVALELDGVERGSLEEARVEAVSVAPGAFDPCARVARLRVRRVDRSSVGRSVAADEERQRQRESERTGGPGDDRRGAGRNAGRGAGQGARSAGLVTGEHAGSVRDEGDHRSAGGAFGAPDDVVARRLPSLDATRPARPRRALAPGRRARIEGDASRRGTRPPPATRTR